MDNSTRSLIFACLAGIRFAGPVVLIIAGVELSTPQQLIAIATALTTSVRSVSAAVFTAIYAAAFNTRLAKYIPSYVSEAALKAGLPKSSLMAFLTTLVSENDAALSKMPGITPSIIEAGVVALRQAFADAIRAVWIFAAAFGVFGCFVCLFLGDVKGTMNYRVDAPVEDLRLKNHHEQSL